MFNKQNKFIYDRLDDEFLFPGTSIMVTKMFLRDNVGVRKISL